MRLAIILLVATIAWVTSAVAEESFPYTAYVAHDRTQVRSGPSDDHYATDRLKRGEAIEVYQRAGGGWLSIRPPNTSFSWIAERDVKQDEDRSVGRIVGEHVVSWIGSNLADVNDHKWQVTLDPDEPVAILGRQRIKMVADGKSDLYFKISPPAGEFRWIHEDDVVRSQEELSKRRDEQVELADFRVALRGRPRADTAAPKSSAVKESSTVKGDSEPAPTPKDDFIGRDSAASAPTTTATEKVATSRPRATTPEPLAADPKDIQTRLSEFDTRLSLLVAQPVEKWDVSQLKKDAQQLADRASSTLERARIQLFLDKIASFEALKSKHALFAPVATNGDSPKGKDKEKDKDTAAADPSDKKAELDPRFDGTGWLLPVHSQKRSAPPYALLDKEGNILQFVSPAPGLNLNRYLRKEVGIFGQREQAPTGLDKPHLTAGRVIELDRHRR